MRNETNGASCAFEPNSWRSGRVFALVPASGGPIPGQAIMAPLNTSVACSRSAAPSLQLNAVTVRGGMLTAELLNATGAVIPGYGTDDVTAPFTGDDPDGSLGWRARSGPLPAVVTEVRVRVLLTRARLYGMHLKC